MKIVVNVCYGGFYLSPEAEYFLMEKYGVKGNEVDRNDPRLVDCVETLGGFAAGGRISELGIIEIPDDVEWEIEEYDGYEHVVEKHRSWHYERK
jgi:hypothetical protein